jgi:hypothetical protein
LTLLPLLASDIYVVMVYVKVGAVAQPWCFDLCLLHLHRVTLLPLLASDIYVVMEYVKVGAVAQPFCLQQV